MHADNESKEKSDLLYEPLIVGCEPAYLTDKAPVS